MSPVDRAGSDGTLIAANGSVEDDGERVGVDTAEKMLLGEVAEKDGNSDALEAEVG